MRRDEKQEPSDEALIAGMAHGDERAAVAFVRRYQRRVYGLAHALIGDVTLAEDVAQETMVRVWRHAEVFDPRRGSAKTWALTIARNLAIDALRLRRATPVEPDQLVELLGRDRSAEDAYTAVQNSSIVRGALAGLPRDQQRALVYAALYGYTAAEVAAAESIPLGTAKSRIRAGLMKLETALTLAGEGR